MNDMHTMHDEINESMVRRLSDAMLAMRGGAGDIGQAMQIDAGEPSISIDAQGQTDAAGDIRCGQGSIA